MPNAKERYLAKCEDDMAFWCSNEVWIRPKAKVPGGVVQLCPNRAQRKVIAEIDKLELAAQPVRLLVLKARQWGSSSLCQAYVMHRSRFRPYHNALVIADRDNTTRNIMAMNRVMHEHLSPAVTDGWSRVIEKTDRHYEWSNGSILQIDTAGQSEAGRGTTRDFVHGSECAFWARGGSVLDALLPGVPDLPGTAVILESTSNGPAGVFWELWEGSKSDEWSKWERVFVPWTIHEEYDETLPKDLADLARRAEAGDTAALDEISWLSEDERQWMLTGEMSLSQVTWRKRIIATKFKGRENQFKREYPHTEEEAFSAAQGGFLNNDGLEFQQSSLDMSYKTYEVCSDGIPLSDPKAPLIVNELFEDRPMPEQDENGWLHIYEEPDENTFYTIGVDPSEGTGNDYAAFVVRANGRVCALGYRNDISTDILAHYLFCVGRYFNTATIHIERSGGGLAVINTLLRLSYPRLYSTEQFDQAGAAQGQRIGFVASQENVRSLLSMFRHSCNTSIIELRHPRLIQEAKWVRLIARRSSSGDATNYKWGCPGKGRTTKHNERISDDLFRAAALTETVARDIEWVRSIEEEYAERGAPRKMVKQGEVLDYHNPLFDEPMVMEPNPFLDKDGKATYDPFEINAEEVDLQWKLPLP